MTLEELALQGKTTKHNSMAAGITSRLLDIRKSNIQQCLSDFQNIEHRLESVSTIHGIEFINDSKATKINSTWYALESINKPIIWIAGGEDNGNDYSKLIPLVQEKVKAIICIGKDNTKIIKEFSGIFDTIYETQSMEEAVKGAYSLAENNHAVLLSPACNSFDLFKNYDDRGDQFKYFTRKI
ncbi:MAG: cyanophycin synthetase [Bacteroidota bacterium]|nr:cyanophycin synthetase [Bacteroidota bacterium]